MLSKSSVKGEQDPSLAVLGGGEGQKGSLQGGVGGEGQKGSEWGLAAARGGAGTVTPWQQPVAAIRGERRAAKQDLIQAAAARGKKVWRQQEARAERWLQRQEAGPVREPRSRRGIRDSRRCREDA
ncbi:hypothetical protein ABZP36_010208 [Zizania latifolia]